MSTPVHGDPLYDAEIMQRGDRYIELIQMKPIQLDMKTCIKLLKVAAACMILALKWLPVRLAQSESAHDTATKKRNKKSA